MTAASKGPAILGVCALLGLLGVAATYVVSGPERFFVNWLVWFLFVLSIGLGCLFVVALGHLVGPVWSVTLRRVPERLSSLVLLAVPTALVGLLSLPVLYPWTHPERIEDPMVLGKLGWLNGPFFTARTLVCLALWVGFFLFYFRGSLAQDLSGDSRFSVRAKRLAPVFLAVFAVTITLVAFDWVSSLEPAWYSDIFGVYMFAGAFLSGLAATALGISYLQARGRLQEVKPDHLYNVGGLMFAFTVFWSYIAFAQYMLMWYADMPEEVFWYKKRLEGPWLVAALLLAVAHFAVPFFSLVSREAKGSIRRLRWVALWVLGSQVLDLYWMIGPVLGERFLPGWQEASFALFFLSLGLLWARRTMALGKDLPAGDPHLPQGLAFRLH